MTCKLLLTATVCAAALTFPGSRSLAGPLRAEPGTLRVTITQAPREEVLDSLVSRAVAEGYTLYRKKNTSAVLLKEATLREVSLVGRPNDTAARRRLNFEVYRRRTGGVRAIGTMEMVAGLGTVGEKAVRVDRQQPYRNELKAMLDQVRDAFAASH